MMSTRTSRKPTTADVETRKPIACGRSHRDPCCWALMPEARGGSRRPGFFGALLCSVPAQKLPEYGVEIGKTELDHRSAGRRCAR